MLEKYKSKCAVEIIASPQCTDFIRLGPVPHNLPFKFDVRVFAGNVQPQFAGYGAVRSPSEPLS